MTDFRLLNPEPFVEPEAIHLSRVFAVLSWDALLGKRTWLTRLELDVASIHLIRPRQGLSNLEILGENAEAWEEAHPPQAAIRRQTVAAGWVGARPRKAASAAPAPASAPELQIDELWIRIGDVHVVDYKLGRYEPVTFDAEVNREKTYHDITDLDALGEELAIDFGVDALFGQFSELEAVFPGLSDGVKDLLKQANTPGTREAEELEEAVDMFKDALDNLFD
jgi:uncharacterized protein involved in outer membrane biogenesis